MCVCVMSCTVLMSIFCTNIFKVENEYVNTLPILFMHKICTAKYSCTVCIVFMYYTELLVFFSSTENSH